MAQKSKISVRFFFQAKITLLRRLALKRFISDFFIKSGKTFGALKIIFCSDDDLLHINQNFLKHDYYTDIITFPFSEANSTRLDAEIYISIDRIKENAVLHNASVSHELHRVIFHGCLHLVGFKDKSRAHALRMRENEDKLLKEYFCFT